MLGYLQTGLDNVLWLWHPADLLVPDPGRLSPHEQLTILLAEKVRAQDTVRVLSVIADDNPMLCQSECLQQQ